MRFAMNTANTFMKSVCFGGVDLYADSMVSLRSGDRVAEVCKTLMPYGEGCEKRDLGRGG